MIVSMKRMTLVAHKADETAILKALQAIRSVEIIAEGDENAENNTAIAPRRPSETRPTPSRTLVSKNR